MCFFIKNEIRYNRKSQHYGVLKNKSRRGITSVFMTTKKFSSGKLNIPMNKNAEINNNEPSYFIKRVRTYEKGSYGGKEKNYKLSKEDIKLSDKIYKEHLKNRKMMKKRKKKEQHHS